MKAYLPPVKKTDEGETASFFEVPTYTKSYVAPQLSTPKKVVSAVIWVCGVLILGTWLFTGGSEESGLAPTTHAEVTEDTTTEFEKQQNKERAKELYEKVKKWPAVNIEQNYNGYSRLEKLDPDNPFYRQKRLHYKELVAEKNAKAERQANRRELIEENFSGWDGSHYHLKRWVKEKMRDPKSFDHINTTYVDKGSYLIVTMNYRGRNGFGGMSVETTRARVSLEGRVLEIL